MNARDVMTRNVVVATPKMALADVARLLIEHRITGLPVVDDANHVVGVITERDLIRTVGEPHRQWNDVAALMTRNPVVVAADAPLEDVFDQLMTHSFRRVMVVEGGLLVGVISRTDLMPAILEHLLEEA